MKKSKLENFSEEKDRFYFLTAKSELLYCNYLVYRPWTSLSFIILKAIGFDHLPFADDGLASNSVTFSKQGRLKKGSKCLLSRENHNYRK